MTLIAAMILAICVLAPDIVSAERSYEDTALVKGGTFLMGTREADIPALKIRYALDFPGIFENETPAHEVTLSSFRIDRYEVTNARYAEFLAENPAWRREDMPQNDHNGAYLADWTAGRMPGGKAHHPVVNITWASAQAYCRWRGGRLPTEAEWEYVARSGDDREFPWGDDATTAGRGNFYVSGIGGTTEVGRYAANDLGVYDLAGNVWEFLYDEWAEDYPREAQIDPLVGGPVADDALRQVTSRRSVRGASYGGVDVNFRTRWRDSHVVTNAVEFVGFRCAYPEGS